MIHDTQSAQISKKQDGRNVYVIMKTMCHHGYLHNSFVTTHELRHMTYGLHIAGINEPKSALQVKQEA